jgi:UPF0755 protein
VAGRRAVQATLLVVLALLAAAAASGYVFWLGYTGPGPSGQPVTLIMPKGEGAWALANRLAEAGVVRNAPTFFLGSEVDGSARRLRAGEYAFNAGISARDAAALIASGQTVKRRLTVPEGLTVAEIVRLIDGADGLTGSVPAAPAEGTLLPETYFFSYGDLKADMLARLRRAMGETIEQMWRERAEGLPLASPREAVILASIVEKETAVDAERPRVAAVFYNRLKRGMKLQSDPTVIYGLSNGKGPLGRELSRADLNGQSPYNTYQIAALPPGPIGNPGRASLRAALHPAQTEELYFVADGTGGHVFARTLDEHNRNVARWRAFNRAKSEAAQ